MLARKTTVWRNRYRKGREEYYNRNDWGTDAWEIRERQKEEMERELINREKELQRQEEDKIFKAKYNIRYKDINVQSRGPSIYGKQKRWKISVKVRK